MNHISENKPEIEFVYIIGKDLLGEVKQLFREYAQSLSVDLCFQNFDEELNSLLEKYGPPDGVLILSRVDGRNAGCVALRRISDEICEMKRLYVRDSYRGLGIGKKLINKVIDEASKRKYKFIRLDTLPTMKEAQNLYKYLGFYDIEPYVYNPVEGTRYLELKI